MVIVKHRIKVVYLFVLSFLLISQVFASIQTWDFNTVGDYTISDLAKIEISDGVGKFIGTPNHYPITVGLNIVPNNTLIFIGSLSSFVETRGDGDTSLSSDVKYFVSSDDGETWKCWEYGVWTTEDICIGGTEASEINAHIATLDTDGGQFRWKAFMKSWPPLGDPGGDEFVGVNQVEIDQIDIGYTGIGISSEGGCGLACRIGKILQGEKNCRDERALNYVDYGISDESLCEYPLAPVFITNENLEVRSGETFITNIEVTSDQVLEYTLVDSFGTDNDTEYLSINRETGALNFKQAQNLANLPTHLMRTSPIKTRTLPLDEFVIEVEVTDGYNRISKFFKIKIISNTNDDPPHEEIENQAPIFSDEIFILKGETFVVNVSAIDSDKDDLTYSIILQDSGNKFKINSTTGKLEFKEAPDFQNPQGENDENLYLVTVQADDGEFQVEKLLKIRVINNEDNDNKEKEEDNNLDTTKKPNINEIAFTEIMYDTNHPLDEDKSEWLEIHNQVDHDLDLTGCVIDDASGQDPLNLDGLTLSANGYMVFARSTNSNENGGLNNVARAFNFSLNNGGDTLTMTCNAGDIDTLTYDDNADDWPDARGTSTQLDSMSTNEIDTNDGRLWCASSRQYLNNPSHYGTPGLPNHPCEVDYCRLQWNPEVEANQGDTIDYYTRFYRFGVTNKNSPAPAEWLVEFGFGPDGVSPQEDSWQWQSSITNPDWNFELESLDEWKSTFHAEETGVFNTAFRISTNNGQQWLYCDSDESGSSNGFNNPGNLIVENVNLPPVIHTSSTHIINVSKDVTDVITVDASDPENDILHFSVKQGLQGELFKINETTGKLEFKEAPEFENHQGQNEDSNFYSVIVTVWDGHNEIVEKTLNIRIINNDISSQYCVRYADNNRRQSAPWRCVGINQELNLDFAGNVNWDDDLDYKIVSNNPVLQDLQYCVRYADNNRRQSAPWRCVGINQELNLDFAGNVNWDDDLDYKIVSNDPALQNLQYCVRYADSDGRQWARWKCVGINQELNLDFAGNVNRDDDLDYKIIWEGPNETDDEVNEDENNPPIIHAISNEIRVVENLTNVATISASDPDGDDLIYSIISRDSEKKFKTGQEESIPFNFAPKLNLDGDKFTIDQQGNLQFKVAPDFENPQGKNGKNIYFVTVQVSDGIYNVNKSFKIKVLNTFEKGEEDINLVIENVKLGRKDLEKGHHTPISFDIKNIGNTPFKNRIKTRCYLSSDENININEDILISPIIRRYPIMSTSNRVSDRFQINIPEDTEYGNYYVGCVVDYNDAIIESNEIDNISPLVPLKIIGFHINYIVDSAISHEILMSGIHILQEDIRDYVTTIATNFYSRMVFAIEPGLQGDKFKISQDGELRFKEIPDENQPQGMSDDPNLYSVIVSLWDGISPSIKRQINVRVGRDPAAISINNIELMSEEDRGRLVSGQLKKNDLAWIYLDLKESGKFFTGNKPIIFNGGTSNGFEENEDVYLRHLRTECYLSSDRNITRDDIFLESDYPVQEYHDTLEHIPDAEILRPVSHQRLLVRIPENINTGQHYIGCMMADNGHPEAKTDVFGSRVNPVPIIIQEKN